MLHKGSHLCPGMDNATFLQSYKCSKNRIPVIWYLISTNFNFSFCLLLHFSNCMYESRLYKSCKYIIKTTIWSPVVLCQLHPIKLISLNSDFSHLWSSCQGFLPISKLFLNYQNLLMHNEIWVQMVRVLEQKSTMYSTWNLKHNSQRLFPTLYVVVVVLLLLPALFLLALQEGPRK